MPNYIAAHVQHLGDDTHYAVAIAENKLTFPLLYPHIKASEEATASLGVLMGNAGYNDPRGSHDLRGALSKFFVHELGFRVDPAAGGAAQHGKDPDGSDRGREHTLAMAAVSPEHIVVSAGVTAVRACSPSTAPTHPPTHAHTLSPCHPAYLPTHALQ